jgi:galactokinase
MHVSAFAPGRVNLIGDHTDHTGGLVLPMAIELGTTVEGRREGDRIALRSDALEGAVDLPISIGDPSTVSPDWGRYVAGVTAEVAPTAGLRGSISSNLPVGSGLSSSAALSVAVALALGAPVDAPLEVARLCQRAEQRALGVPCGIMDQLASVAGRVGHALLIDTGHVTWTAVPIPPDVEVRVLDSGHARTLATSGYAAVRDRCVRAAEELGSLVDVDPELWRGVDEVSVRDAARHVIGENLRVRSVAAALERGDAVAAGRLMGESHRSLAHLGVSTAALDTLVARLEGTPGVFGARLTGAGFGGWVVALVVPGSLSEGRAVRPSDGARVTER